MGMQFKMPGEACLEIAVSIPTWPADNRSPEPNGYHAKKLHFYGEAFAAPNDNIRVSKVTEIGDDIVPDRYMQVALNSDQLWLVSLTYNPMELATAHVHDDADYTDDEEAQRCIQVLRQAKDTPRSKSKPRQRYSTVAGQFS